MKDFGTRLEEVFFFCLQPIGQKSVMGPHVSTRDPRKCSLIVCFPLKVSLVTQLVKNLPAA